LATDELTAVGWVSSNLGVLKRLARYSSPLVALGAALAQAGNPANIISTLVAIGSDPGTFIREIIYGELVLGILRLASPLIDALLIVVIGESVGYNEHGVWGIEDVILFVPITLYDVSLWSVTSLYDALLAVNRAIIPLESGLVYGVFVYGFLIVEFVIVAELSRRLLRAVLDSVPILSGVETFLFSLFLAKIGYRVYQNYEDNESQV